MCEQDGHAVAVDVTNKAICVADRILLVNTFEGDILDWLDEMLAVALGLDGPAQLPLFIDSGDVGDLDKAKWLGFENYILVTDR